MLPVIVSTWAPAGSPAVCHALVYWPQRKPDSAYTLNLTWIDPPAGRAVNAAMTGCPGVSSVMLPTWVCAVPPRYCTIASQLVALVGQIGGCVLVPWVGSGPTTAVTSSVRTRVTS